MSALAIENLSKTYANGVRAVEAVSFQVPSGGFCVLLGPSGCGKSTTLRMVAGLEAISGGTIRIDGTAINHLHPKDRDIAMVFQNYALYPHLTVEQNIAFPLSMRGVKKVEIRARVRSVAEMLQLTEELGRRPSQLSGGQRQRVALARAIVREPKVFLFDEPLSNLDARMRHQTRSELRALHQRLRITSLYVTHDQEEAMSLADLIVVMAGGRVRQVGGPMDVFEFPADRFVAGFIGSPPMNFFEATLRGSGPLKLETSLGFNAIVKSPDGTQVQVHSGDRVVLGIRPGSIHVQPLTAGGPQAHVESVELLGETMDLTLKAGSCQLCARVPADRAIQPGQDVSLSFDLASVHLFEPGPDGRRITAVLEDLPVHT
jgi:multiple sugar transport system ATP-binding protein